MVFRRKEICWLILLGLSLVVSGCGSRDVKSIVIRGSDTEVNLVLRLAETYMQKDPDISIAVTGGGSGVGIASLINKRTDIANSSRAFSEDELQLAEERGVDVRPIVFAMDALCFIVNEELPLDELTLDQVRAIYTGKVKSWREYCDYEGSISLYGRQGNSGTFIYIQQEILKQDYSFEMKQMNGNSQIIEGIRNDKTGIGYVGIGYVVDHKGEEMKGIKVLAIKGDGQEYAVDPSQPANIISGNYQVVRPLYQYIDGKPDKKLLDFLDYELSAEGEKIIIENGYYPTSQKIRMENEKYMGDF